MISQVQLANSRIHHQVHFGNSPSRHWPIDEVVAVQDVDALTSTLNSSSNGVNDSLRAMFILGMSRRGLLEQLTYKAQCFANGTVSHQQEVAQKELLPAAKAFAAFFTAIAKQLEPST